MILQHTKYRPGHDLRVTGSDMSVSLGLKDAIARGGGIVLF